jgi:hypothetical protein
MNCEDFNNILAELADYKPMQADRRDEGVSHAAVCAGCAMKLVSSRALSSNLLLAAGAESEVAPPRVKQDLVAAFAKQHKVDGPSAAVVNPIVNIATHRRFVWWTAAAAAMAAAIVVAVMLSLWKETSLPVRPSQVATATPAVEPTQSPAVSSSPVDSPPAQGTVDAIRKPRLVAPQTHRKKTSPATPETLAQSTAREFMPLTYLADATAMDTGTVIRVQLSRSALVSLGLPTNIENSRDSVEAEVVVGDDGVARAIRLVQ